MGGGFGFPPAPQQHCCQHYNQQNKTLNAETVNTEHLLQSIWNCKSYTVQIKTIQCKTSDVFSNQCSFHSVQCTVCAAYLVWQTMLGLPPNGIVLKTAITQALNANIMCSLNLCCFAMLCHIDWPQFIFYHLIRQLFSNKKPLQNQCCNEQMWLPGGNSHYRHYLLWIAPENCPLAFEKSLL